MSKFTKKPVTIEATQWFKNGDHPDDACYYVDDKSPDRFLSEGKVVRYFRRPDIDGQSACEKCGNTMHVHGWIDTLEGENGAQVVCPGDFVITGVQGERYPCKPDIFHATYTIPHDDPAVNKIYDHIDDFAQVMKDKMNDMYHAGREGWDDPAHSEQIVKRLQNAVARLCDTEEDEYTYDFDQAVDVANLAMMMHFFDPDN